MTRSTPSARPSCKTIVQMHDHCEGEFQQALEQIGARDIHLESAAY